MRDLQENIVPSFQQNKGNLFLYENMGLAYPICREFHHQASPQAGDRLDQRLRHGGLVHRQGLRPSSDAEDTAVRSLRVLQDCAGGRL